jgi:hypothetical protein
MRTSHQQIFAAAIVLAAWGSASSASAQTVVNLTNLDPSATGYGALTTTTSNASTSLDLLNRTTALSNGGLFPGAVSNQNQTAYNQLNTLGINANGSVSPVVLGNQTPVAGTPNMVEINTITSAYNAVQTGTLTGTSSTTINNINAAISSAVNPIIGAAASTNGPWTGGYGGTASGAALTANQVGVNTINGVGAAFADGTNVALSQLPGAPTPATIATPATASALATNATNTNAAYLAAVSTQTGTNSAATTASGLVTSTLTTSNADAAAAATAAATALATPTASNIAALNAANTAAAASLAAYNSAVAANTVAQAANAAAAAATSAALTAANTAATATTLAGVNAAAAAAAAVPHGATPIIQGGSLNMSTTNTLLAYSPAGTVSINGNNGVSSTGAPVRGNQSAVNTFNASTLVGTNISAGVQQLADGLNSAQTALASVNRALAYSPGSQVSNIDPSVTNLNQTAAVGLNALNLQSGAAATNATLSGMQSTGYNTGVAPGGTTAGTVPVAVATNQIVASTVGAGGFMPSSTNAASALTDWQGLVAGIATGAPIPGSAGFAAVTTGQNASAFLGGSFTPNVSGATNPYTTLNAGTVNVANANQAVNLTNNTVSAGSAASPVNVSFGPAGFEQRTGTVGIASNSAGSTPALASGLGGAVGTPGGLSNAQALTGVGSASIADLGQTFQTANNTFQGTGNVDGSLTQQTTGLAFNAAAIASGSTSGYAVNGGSGMNSGGTSPTNTGYVLATAGTASALNNAVAGAVYGPIGLTNVAQSGTSFANIAAATGTIDTAASGTLAQNLGEISGYTGVQNAAVATSVASGNVSATGTNQSLNMTGNAIQAASVNGSIAQIADGSAPASLTSTGGFGATNAVLASAGNGTATGQGRASLASTTQSNTTTLNAIQSAGALGSSSVPAGIAQQSGTASTSLGNSAYSSTLAGFNTAFIAPSNLAVVQATDGAGGSATSNISLQQANLSVNNIVGGTAGGLGITGNSTQVSYGQATSIGNQALAYAGNAPRGATSLTGGTGVATNAAVGSNMLGAQGVMSGNAALTNQQQQATQSLNTMALAGANNGNLNQATFGATNQTSGNQLYAQSNGGYALTTGAQTATNAVNVITAR